MDHSFGMRRMPTGASLFSAYASLSATYTLIQQAIYQFVPPAVRDYVYDLLKKLFTRSSSPSPDLFTLIIEERSDGSRNEIFDACQIYLCNRMNDSANMLKVSRAPNEETMSFKLAKGVKFSETFEEIHLNWSFHSAVVSDNAVPSHHQFPVMKEMKNQSNHKSAYFSLTFNKEHKKKVCNSYLPFVVETSKDIGREGKVLKLADCSGGFGMPPPRVGKSKQAVSMTHPFTFDKLAMDPEMKKWIVDDLDRFVKRKEFYRRVGKPWKRGYLLYGPPGTGKSSLIAAIANHLKFDIYDLQLGSIYNHSSLRDMLLWLPSESIIVIEDIDRSQGIRRKLPKKKFEFDDEFDDSDEDDRTASDLAPLLNFVDGLWSCCGDERLIVFTTNHKEKLDPALLRPGRMDMHIHMSYLTMPGFKVLACNYLRANEHRLFGEIESLLKITNATPAEVAEELMRSEDVDVALNGVIELLKGKKPKADDAENIQTLLETKSQEPRENGALVANHA